MEKRFTVVIVEEGQEKTIIGPEWRGGAHEDGERHGYTPEIEGTREYKREVYRQQIKEIDIPTVVAAINKLPNPNNN